MIKLRQYQIDGINQVAYNYQNGIKRQVYQLPTGGGKCHARGTKIMMYDGSIKMVEDVKIGDQLMGSDSKPRNVLSLARGKEMMYKIIPIKGDYYIVNESHILSLKYTGSESIRNISVKDYLNLNKNQKHLLKGYRVGLDFNKKEIDFDPYVLGIWLAEGTHNRPVISNPDYEVIDYLKQYALTLPNTFLRFENKDNEKCINTVFSSKISSGRRGGSNPFLNYLKKYNLISNKHIPNIYKINSREVRLQVLAGLLDGDGYLNHNGYEILTKYEQLNNDILFLARSLGLAAYSTYTKKINTTTGIGGYYYRININGDTDIIPCRIKRKKASKRLQKKDVLKYGFSVEKLKEDDYFGFEIDGNHLYLLGDFTVTHNTVTFGGLCQRFLAKHNKSILICVHREELLSSARNTLYNGFGIYSESITAGRKHIPQSKVYVGMIETVNNMLKRREAWAQHIGLIIVDECHIANFNKIYDYFNQALILGFTATPIAASKKDPLKNYFDAIVTGPQINELIEMGSLCENVTYGIKGIETKNFNIKRGEFDNFQMGNEFSKSKNVLNCVKKYEEKCEGKKTIVFNCNIAHSKLVNESFISYGYNSKHLDGTESKDERIKIFEWFKNNDDAILNNVSVATTGFDEPSIINVIVNRSTMSMPLWLQMCGRGSRPFKNKEYFNIIDLGGNTKLHGDWRVFRNWNNIFNNPDKPSDGNGIAPIKNCEKCEAMIPAQSIICKYCGHEHLRVINYDQINLELEMIIGRINVESKHKENTERGYKDFKTFFDILNTTFAIMKNSGNEVWDLRYKEKHYAKFFEKVKEWCKLSGRANTKFIQNFSKEQFDKKYLETKKMTLI